MMLDWPDDTFVEQLPTPAFTAAVIFSLSFLMVHNVDLGGSSTLQMAAVNFPPSYLLKIAIFCSKVIDFRAFFLPGASLALTPHFGAMMHKRSLHKNTQEDDRENTNNAQKSIREQMHKAREGRLKETHTSCLLPPFAPPTSQHISYITTYQNAYVWVGSACWVDSPVFGFSFSALRRLSLTCTQKLRTVYLIMHYK